MIFFGVRRQATYSQQMAALWVPPNDISASGGGGANMKKTELEQPTSILYPIRV